MNTITKQTSFMDASKRTAAIGGGYFKTLLTLFILFLSVGVWGQNSLNSGDFSGGSWGSGQAMSASAGGSLIITKAVTSSGDKFFRFFGDGTPCGEYQPNTNGDAFVHNTVVTSPNANCGGSNAWKINVPTTSSNVVFKTDGGNDGMDRSIAFVIQGAVRSFSGTPHARDVTTPTYLQSPVVTATLSTGTLNTGQGIYLRYTTDNFVTSTIVSMSFSSGTSYTASIPAFATGTTVTYYMFTSGNGLSITHADADFYTINLTGSYSYITVGVSRFAVASGNWDATSTWSATSGGASGASVPIAGDDVTIEGGRTVTVTANAAAKSVTFNGTTANTLSVNTGITLTVSGAVTLNGDNSSSTTCTISGSGTINCGSITVGNSSISPNLTGGPIMTSTISNLTITGTGNLTLEARTSGSNYYNPRFYLNSGVLTVPGQIVVNGIQNNSSSIARFWMDQGAQSGTLILTGATPWGTCVNCPSGQWLRVLNSTSSTVNYARGGDQTVLGTTYNNLTISGSGNKTLTGVTLSGTLSVEGSAVGITTAPTFGLSSTLQYRNVGNRTTNSIEWPSLNGPRNLIIDNSGGTVTMLSGNARTLTNNLTLTAGTLADNGNTLTVNGNIAGTGTHSGSGKILLNTSGSTISGATLGNLELSSSGGSFSLTGNPTINGTLTLTNGTFNVGASGVVTIGSGGTISPTSGVLGVSTGAGTFTFQGIGSVTGTIGFNNVNIAGGVNFGSASTINGILSINSGGFVNTNAPIYASGSTLRYNTTGPYGRGSEWSATTGAGYPNNVQVSNNTTVDLSANSGTSTARQCASNLTIDSGSTITLGAMNQALTVLGKYTNNGTTILSTEVGGDIKLQGDMDDNGTFTANGRAIFFEGGNTQTINSSTNPLDVDVMRIGKLGGEVILAQNLLVDETNDPIQFTTAQSVLNLNGKTATFGKAGTASAITMNASSKIKGSSLSSLTILGSGDFGSLYFDQTTPGITNTLNNFILNRSTGGKVSLGSDIVITGSLTQTAGKLAVGTKTLTLNGAYIGDATNSITGGLSSNLTTTGSAGTLYFDQTTPGSTNVLKNLTISSGSATLGNALNITAGSTPGVLSVGASATLNAGGNLTLKSDANGTARVSEVGASGAINGNVTVERYIPSKRAWRALTAPLKGSNTTLYNSWQNAGVSASPYTTGVELWGPGGTGASGNGLASGPGASIKQYTTSGWADVTNTQSTNLFTSSANNAYMVFVTGGYGSNNIGNGLSAATTLKATGQLITGPVSFAVTSARHTLVGNPFASPLSPSAILDGNTQANLYTNIWMWDPAISTNGAYVNYDASINSGTFSDVSGSYSSSTTAIQSGQAFFVRAVANTDTLTLTESMKSSSISNTFRNSNSIAASVFRLGFAKQIGTDWMPLDGCIAAFYDAANPAVDVADGTKMVNTYENIAFVRGTTNLSIEHYPLVNATDQLNVKIWNAQQAHYKLKLNTEEFTMAGVEAYLQDLYTGTTQPLNLDGSMQDYEFDVDPTVSASSGNRFRIVFTNTALAVTNPEQGQLSIYPNPVTGGKVTVSLPTGNFEGCSYELINVLGQVVRQDEIANANSSQVSIPLTGLPNSWYALRIRKDNKVVYQGKLIIQN